jgi:cytochrome o ubiquinol oxidase subunit 2
MHFQVRALSPESYRAWVDSTRGNSAALDGTRYAQLAVPSLRDEPVSFGTVTPGLFDAIVHNHGAPIATTSSATADTRIF